MYPIGNVSDGHLTFRPVWKQWLKDASAHLAVQPADPVDLPASPQGEIGHIETFAGIIRVMTAKGK